MTLSSGAPQGQHSRVSTWLGKHPVPTMPCLFHHLIPAHSANLKSPRSQRSHLHIQWQEFVPGGSDHVWQWAIAICIQSSVINLENTLLPPQLSRNPTPAPPNPAHSKLNFLDPEGLQENRVMLQGTPSHQHLQIPPKDYTQFLPAVKAPGVQCRSIWNT